MEKEHAFCSYIIDKFLLYIITIILGNWYIYTWHLNYFYFPFPTSLSLHARYFNCLEKLFKNPLFKKNPYVILCICVWSLHNFKEICTSTSLVLNLDLHVFAGKCASGCVCMSLSQVSNTSNTSSSSCFSRYLYNNKLK